MRLNSNFCPAPIFRIIVECATDISSNHMKSLALSLLLAISACGASAAAVTPVTVQFTDPAKFTDFLIRGRDANYTAGIFASEVTAELTPVMRQKYLNSSLVLRFTDIDLAGRYATAGGIRVAQDTPPARMNFDFALTDSNGKSLAKGSTRLVDSSSMGSHSRRRSQVFYYESRLLNRWLRTLAPRR